MLHTEAAVAGQEHASKRAPAEAARHSALAVLVAACSNSAVRSCTECDAVLALAPANQKAQLRCTNARENTWAQ